MWQIYCVYDLCIILCHVIIVSKVIYRILLPNWNHNSYVFLLGALTVGWLSMGYFGALVSRETFTICCCTLALGKTFRFPLLVWGDWCVWLPERSSHDIVAHWLKQNLILPFKTPKLLGLTSILNLNDTHIVLPLDFLIYRNVGEDCLGRLQKNYELLQASTFESLATTPNRCVYCVLGNNAKNMCLLCSHQTRVFVPTLFDICLQH